jgi:hypothetical protein
MDELRREMEGDKNRCNQLIYDYVDAVNPMA